jgi:quercetin dioxygenase-like cupin family protein
MIALRKERYHERFKQQYHFPEGRQIAPQFSKSFIGTAYLQMLVPAGTEFNCPIGNVTFEPGCRNNWHKHPGGQILLVTGGRGWYHDQDSSSFNWYNKC